MLLLRSACRVPSAAALNAPSVPVMPNAVCVAAGTELIRTDAAHLLHALLKE